MRVEAASSPVASSGSEVGSGTSTAALGEIDDVDTIGLIVQNQLRTVVGIRVHVFQFGFTQCVGWRCRPHSSDLAIRKVVGRRSTIRIEVVHGSTTQSISFQKINRAISIDIDPFLADIHLHVVTGRSAAIRIDQQSDMRRIPGFDKCGGSAIDRAGNR